MDCGSRAAAFQEKRELRTRTPNPALCTKLRSSCIPTKPWFDMSLKWRVRIRLLPSVARDGLVSYVLAAVQVLRHDSLTNPDGSLSQGSMRLVFLRMGETRHRHRGYRLGMRLLSRRRPSGTPSGTISLSPRYRTRGRNGDSMSHISERSSRSIWYPHSCHTTPGRTQGWPGASPGAGTTGRTSRLNTGSMSHCSGQRTSASMGLTLASLFALPSSWLRATINTSH